MLKSENTSKCRQVQDSFKLEQESVIRKAVKCKAGSVFVRVHGDQIVEKIVKEQRQKHLVPTEVMNEIQSQIQQAPQKSNESRGSELRIATVFVSNDEQEDSKYGEKKGCCLVM